MYPFKGHFPKGEKDNSAFPKNLEEKVINSPKIYYKKCETTNLQEVSNSDTSGYILRGRS